MDDEVVSARADAGCKVTGVGVADGAGDGGGGPRRVAVLAFHGRGEGVGGGAGGGVLDVLERDIIRKVCVSPYVRVYTRNGKKFQSTLPTPCGRAGKPFAGSRV